MRKQKKDDISFKNKGMNVVFLMDSLSAICKNHVFSGLSATSLFFLFRFGVQRRNLSGDVVVNRSRCRFGFIYRW
ncbi:UNVERIFIED_CONTAM: hypothetical protein ABIC26_004745 [Paenibacillus sp. PvR008]